jgi:hypothetical protein
MQLVAFSMPSQRTVIQQGNVISDLHGAVNIMGNGDGGGFQLSDYLSN